MKKVFSKMTIKFFTIFFLLNAISSSEILAQIKRRAPSGETATFENPTSQNPMSVLAKPVAQLEESKKEEAKKAKLDSDAQRSTADSLRSGNLTAKEARDALENQDKADEENKDKNPKNPQAASVSMPAAVTAKSSSSAANWLLPLAAIAGVGAIALLASGSDDPSSSADALPFSNSPELQASLLDEHSFTWSSEGSTGTKTQTETVRTVSLSKLEDFLGKNLPDAYDPNSEKSAEGQAKDYFKANSGVDEGVKNNVMQAAVMVDALKDMAGEDFLCGGSGEGDACQATDSLMPKLLEFVGFQEQYLNNNGTGEQAQKVADRALANLRSYKATIQENIEIFKSSAQAETNPGIIRLYNNAAGILEAFVDKVEKSQTVAELKPLKAPLQSGKWSRFVDQHKVYGFTPDVANPAAATRDLLTSATRAPTLLAELPAERGVLDTYSPHRGAPSDQWISPSDAADFRNL